jgi:type I restriction enzyme, S subunit
VSGPADLVALPNRWQRIQLRRVATIRNGADYKHIEVSDGGYPVYGSGGIFKRASDYLYDGESVLFGRKGTIDRPLHVSGRFWTVDTMFYTRLSERIVGRFLYYYATTMPYSYYSTSTALPSMTQGGLAGHAIPLPPLEEQCAIADFLDEQTSRIDTLIAKQDHLIDTLQERRRAVVEHAVWTGLRRSETVQSAEIGCAPSVPIHWDWTRNKNILVERDDLSFDGSEELLTVSHLTGITPRSEKKVTMIEAESHAGYRLVSSGDLVINTMWAWMGALGISRNVGMVSPAYGVYTFRDRNQTDPRFFDYLFRSRQYVTEMTRFSRGVWTSRLRLYPESFLQLPVVVPPIVEQREIVKYVDEQTSRIDALIAKTTEHIGLAKERRAALITAAVTGQIDARTAAQTSAT